MKGKVIMNKRERRGEGIKGKVILNNRGREEGDKRLGVKSKVTMHMRERGKRPNTKGEVVNVATLATNTQTKA